ncbi:hypothetical protein KY321_02060 [Candidatus Woesearchaeota archaeon]|nr:hypothetical protein [Candidatus Woesearchaeota archaeon]
MPYDPELDVKKFSEEIEMEDSKIVVSIMSYNDGTPKLQISREKADAEGNFRFAKLGRMTKEEVEKVLPAIEKAKDNM